MLDTLPRLTPQFLLGNRFCSSANIVLLHAVRGTQLDALESPYLRDLNRMRAWYAHVAVVHDILQLPYGRYSLQKNSEGVATTEMTTKNSVA